ncbi:unnamed protein product [Bursaphelenchus xylophilus]|uniref:(pine wood nematode) hypothetical protein n=1 Tax=Bursaphelenchus xylophilus TaxID=6326 RepID=A0A1I7RNZ1_BURXY|nr:unnamed protein product [Bursaphelenchus xylophilus]CAG9124400.1 unnamed protein product [Bursaphelenchus xylophilus]
MSSRPKREVKRRSRYSPPLEAPPVSAPTPPPPVKPPIKKRTPAGPRKGARNNKAPETVEVKHELNNVELGTSIQSVKEVPLVVSEVKQEFSNINASGDAKVENVPSQVTPSVKPPLTRVPSTSRPRRSQIKPARFSPVPEPKPGVSFELNQGGSVDHPFAKNTSGFELPDEIIKSALHRKNSRPATPSAAATSQNKSLTLDVQTSSKTISQPSPASVSSAVSVKTESTPDTALPRPRLSSIFKLGRKCVEACKERSESPIVKAETPPVPKTPEPLLQPSTSHETPQNGNISLLQTDTKAEEGMEISTESPITEPGVKKKASRRKLAPRVLSLLGAEEMVSSRKRRIKPVAKFSPSRNDGNKSSFYDSPPVKVPKVAPLKIITNPVDPATPSVPPPTACYPFTPDFYLPDQTSLQLALESQKRQYELANIQSQQEAAKRDLSTSLLEGRKPRNKALSISQFAPELIKGSLDSTTPKPAGSGTGRRGRPARTSTCEAFTPQSALPRQPAFHYPPQHVEVAQDEVAQPNDHEPSPEKTPVKPKPLKKYQSFGTTKAQGYAHRPFFEEMKARKELNPLAVGLVFERKLVTPDDYFYREVLIRREDGRSGSGRREEEVDILEGVSEDKLDIEAEENEILIKNPAFDCVADVRKEVPFAFEGQEDDDTESPMERIEKEVLEMDNPYQRQHLTTLLAYISSQRLIDLNTLEVKGGCSLFYTQTLKNASRMRENLLLYTVARMDALTASHAYLIRKLPDEFLASYLNLLRFLKLTGTQLPVYLTGRATEPEVEKGNVHIAEFLDSKLTDPGTRFNKVLQINPIPGVSLVLVYPQIICGNQVINKHAHENMFRNLLPAAIRCVEKVELRFSSMVDSKTLTHMCLEMIRQRVKEIAKRRADDHIFLAGWGTSCLLNIQAIRKISGVSGVLNFAFPMKNHIGVRGTVDDNICITYCPSLFVVGENASNCDIQEMQEMRQNMICDSGLIVIGNADKNLYVSPTALSIERASQHCVDRLILEHTTDFIKQVVAEGGLSVKDKRQFLKPVKLPSQFEVDVNTLKGRASGVIGTNKGKPVKGALVKKDSSVNLDSVMPPIVSKYKPVQPYTGAPRGRPPKNAQKPKPPMISPALGVARNAFTQVLKRTTGTVQHVEHRIHPAASRILQPGVHGQAQRVLLPPVRREERPIIHQPRPPPPPQPSQSEAARLQALSDEAAAAAASLQNLFGQDEAEF